MLLNAHDHHSIVTGRHVPFRGFEHITSFALLAIAYRIGINRE